MYVLPMVVNTEQVWRLGGEYVDDSLDGESADKYPWGTVVRSRS